jgi:nucleotidyltransferase/DNA polymerase involved in DNA repair
MEKIASVYCKPKDMLWIAPGKEQQFLGPLPIKHVPRIGPKGFARLNRMGLKSISELSHLTLELLEEKYGKCGASLYRKAMGSVAVLSGQKPKTLVLSAGIILSQRIP